MIGGISALVYVALVLVPVALLFLAPVSPSDGAAVLVYIAEHKVVYMIELVCFVGLAVPGLLVFSALAVALRAVDSGLAVVGGLLGIVSETIALALGSSPQSLHPGLVVLSDTYAGTDDQGARAALAGAADALIAATNAVSWAGILTAAGILVLSLLVRRSGLGARLGVLGMLIGALGVVSEALRPVIGLGYLAYGLLLPVWVGLIGWKILLGHSRTARSTA
jgi:hypothetical protein